jgi:hypothetical protein
MRRLRRSLLSHWCLIVIGAGAFFFTTATRQANEERSGPKVRPMRARLSEGTVGIPIDANTRTIAPPGQEGIRAAAVSNWVVNYSGFTPQAQAAFQHAINIWASRVNSPVPIVVDATMTPLGGGFLAFAGFERGQLRTRGWDPTWIRPFPTSP